jgi:hypothetical protein
MENKQRWYPERSEHLNYEQWNAHRQTLDLVYGLQDQLRELHGKHQELHSKMDGVTKENSKLKEVINNRIAGRLVKPTNPGNGDTIRYSQTTGQFEFGP